MLKKMPTLNQEPRAWSGRRRFLAMLAGLGLIGLPTLASAHEVYVLSQGEITAGFAQTGPNLLPQLWLASNRSLTITIALAVAAVYIAAIFLRQTRPAQRLIARLEQFAPVGLTAVRLAVAVSFLYGAATNALFGPELSLAGLASGPFIRLIEWLAGGLLLVGLFGEAASAAALLGAALIAARVGGYILTYLNYLAELVVLAIFGTRVVSLDGRLFGPSRRWPRLAPYETTIVRIGYGIALIYAAVYVKILHPQLTLDVIHDYHLTQFHWLFPPNPQLIVAGAALAEIMLGLFILIGFGTRLTVAVSLFYLTLSLIFFKEAVWPHLILYGISINLLVAPQRLAVDPWIDRLLATWSQQRPRSPLPQTRA